MLRGAAAAAKKTKMKTTPMTTTKRMSPTRRGAPTRRRRAPLPRREPRGRAASAASTTCAPSAFSRSRALGEGKRNRRRRREKVSFRLACGQSKKRDGGERKTLSRSYLVGVARTSRFLRERVEILPVLASAEGERGRGWRERRTRGSKVWSRTRKKKKGKE